jgi:HAD superfamily hydrolase (TIGR01459 family)
MSGPLRTISGLSQIAGDYEGFILDLWGCLHDGVTAFPAAVEAAQNLKRAGGRILILSNAPRRASEVIARCLELGIDERCYHAVLSSGEDAWRNLKDRSDPWYAALGRRCFHLGPPKDAGMCQGLDLSLVADPGGADFIMNTGAHAPEDTVETYAEVIEAGVAAGVPMVCANPDLEVIRGGKAEICAGALAQRYEELGGAVRYHGKPYPPIYESAEAILGVSDPARILCIGDALRTDVAGANACGMASLWVLDGLHGPALGLTPGGAVSLERVEAEMETIGQRADFTLPVLRW